jgi:hypothetical protein
MMSKAAFMAVVLLSLTGCDRESRVEEPQTSSQPRGDMMSAPPAAKTQATPHDAPPPDIKSPPTDRPVPASLPPNLSLPPGAAVDTSAPLPGGKHTVLALFADESDPRNLLSRITEELAKHGWRPKGEPQAGVNDGLSAEYENDVELLSVSVYAGDSKPGMRAMLQLRPKAKQ